MEQAQGARNQAIGVFSFVAILGGLGLFAAIRPLVETAVDRSATGQAAIQAEAYSERAAAAADGAEAALSTISTSQTEWEAERANDFGILSEQFENDFADHISAQQSVFLDRLAQWDMDITEATNEASATATQIEAEFVQRSDALISRLELSAEDAGTLLEELNSNVSNARVLFVSLNSEYRGRFSDLSERLGTLGDNIEALQEFVEMFDGPLAGTTCEESFSGWQDLPGRGIRYDIEFETPRSRTPVVTIVDRFQSTLFSTEVENASAEGFSVVIETGRWTPLTARAADTRGYCFDWYTSQL